MTCEQVEELIDAVAGGEIPATEAFSAHVQTCPPCAAGLAAATQLERALRAAPAISAPPRFTPAVLARIRKERWLADQQMDWVFNLTIAVAIAMIAIGSLALLNSGGVAAAIMSFSAMVAQAVTEERSAQVQPPLWAYVTVFVLMGTSLLVWGWAESDKS